MYYVTNDRLTHPLCISAAFSDAPTGPFRDASAGPMLCDAVDPHPFIDADGNPYLLWAHNGAIDGSRLGADLTSLVGATTRLVTADEGWEDGIVEAPAVLRQGDNVVLFFSGNRWDSAAYAIGYARCAGPLGPCEQAAGPWIASQGPVRGPGGADVFRDTHGRPWMVFHAWIGPVGYPQGARALLVVALDLTNRKPTITEQ